MEKKRFKVNNNFYKVNNDIYYEVVSEGWLDDDTYVVEFQDMYDDVGDIYHIEAEYHKDTKSIVYVQVYEYEHFQIVFECNKIRDYILHKVGLIADDYMVMSKTISVNLELSIPNKMTIGELNKFLKNLELQVITPTDMSIPMVNVLKVEAKI